MDIRYEQPGDYEAIYALNKRAFEPMAFSDGSEADRVDKLRADGDLKHSLVAPERDRIVGHIAFSPVFISQTPHGWFALGPVCVSPEFQKTGIGSALINKGLDILKKQNAPGCVLIGNPVYYSRFGFVGDGRLSYRQLADEYVQWLAFHDVKPAGQLKFSLGLE